MMMLAAGGLFATYGARMRTISKAIATALALSSAPGALANKLIFQILKVMKLGLCNSFALGIARKLPLIPKIVTMSGEETYSSTLLLLFSRLES
jgi:hypothetical protein